MTVTVSELPAETCLRKLDAVLSALACLSAEAATFVMKKRPPDRDSASNRQAENVSVCESLVRIMLLALTKESTFRCGSGQTKFPDATQLATLMPLGGMPQKVRKQGFLWLFCFKTLRRSVKLASQNDRFASSI
jgi:hypothetical protein